MALQDLAQRSGFTQGIDSFDLLKDVVFLQLEMPASQREMRELFGCQLVVSKQVWEATELYERIVSDGDPNGQRSIVGSLYLPKDTPLVAFTSHFRLLSLFGKEVLRTNFNPENFITNTRVRCLSVERREGRIWLVRGEILSGGLIFGDPRVIESGDLKRVWPNPLNEQRDQFRGIFFTGSELQIEVGAAARWHSSPKLLNQNGMTANQVRVEDDCPSGPLLFLFRSKKNESGATWGAWRSIVSWTGRVLTLDIPYEAEEKPKQGWDYQVYHGERIRRFRLLGVRRNAKTAAVQRAVWEQISASVALSQLPGEPAGLPIDPPANTANRHFESIREMGASLGITLKKREQTTSRSIVVVDGMDGESSTLREFLRVDWNVSFDNRLGKNLSWSPQTLLVHPAKESDALFELVENDESQLALNAATPPAADNRVQRFTFGGTLNENTRFKLRFKGAVSGPIAWSSVQESLQQNILNALNALSTIGKGNVRVTVSTTPTITFLGALALSEVPLLEVESVSTGANVTVDSLAASVQFKWNRGSSAIQPTIPETRLVGTAQDADRRSTQETRETSRELWFQASCAAGTPYEGSALAWANVSAQQPPAFPVGDGARASRLSGPVVYTTSGWTLQATPADPESGRATTSPGVRLTLTKTGSNNEAKLELFAADVTLDSPAFRIYDKPINDPKSVPNERHPQDGTPPTSLRFIHRPEWERVSPGDEQAAVICKHVPVSGVDKFELSRAPQAVRIYLPAERALIDPVSVTRGNLVGQQTVAFPLLQKPEKPNEFLRIVTVQLSTNSEGEPTSRLELELTDGTFPVDETDKFRDFFAQLQPKEPKVSVVVARIRKLERDGANEKLATLELKTDHPIFPGEYRLTVGPTRLALPRDVNHGLIPIGISKFQINSPQDGFASLSFSSDKIRGEEGQAVLALHPWSEWGPRPEAEGNPKWPWLTTGRVRLHHRNLIQEHAEFESSFEDRFPPEGPSKNPDGSIPSPLLPLADFTRAVRDRFTETTGNVIAPAAGLPEKAVRNWLPYSNFIDNAGPLHPRVEMKVDANDLTVLPEANVRTERDIVEDPFSYKAKDGGIEKDFYQSLKLRKATEPGADQHWLDVSVRPEGLAVGSPPTIRLKKTDPTDVTSRRAVDSSVPLLFSRHDTCALASIVLPDGGFVTIVGSAEKDAIAYLFTDTGLLQAKKENPMGNSKPLLDVVLMRDGATVRGLAIEKDGATTRLVSFDVAVKTETQVVKLEFTSPVKIKLATASNVEEYPKELACLPADASAGVAVLATGPTLFLVAGGTATELKTLTAGGASAIAIARHPTNGRRQIGLGYGDGGVRVWEENPPETWKPIARGSARVKDNELLGLSTLTPKERQALEIEAGRSLRSLGLLHEAKQPDNRLLIVALDGTRFPCVWEISPSATGETLPKVWLQATDALAVGITRIVDLEQRDKNDALPFVTLGLRSGVVRFCAAIGRDEVFTDIRKFDAAEAPVTRLSLAGGGTGTTSAVGFTGTSSGQLLPWDVRRGIEWTQVESVTPIAYLDGLGVVRAVPLPATSGNLTVDKLSVCDANGPAVYYSVTTMGLGLVVDNDSGTNAENLTDIQLWADSFKVRTDGTVVPKQFPDGCFDPGHIAFFSTIKAVAGLNSLSVFDHVPRLCGIPFFVTCVRKLKLIEADGTWGVETAEVEGVLINPDEIAAGQDPADAGTLPGVVARALSRGSKIGIEIKSGKLTVVTADSLIDWTFAVNRQEPSEGAEGFPAALARIRSEPNTVMHKDQRLCFEIDKDNSRSLVFGRLWPLSNSVQLISHAVFQRSTERDSWEQTGYSFRTSLTEETLNCEHRWEPSSGNLTISADPKTQVWNGGRYISFHQAAGHKVFVANRTTGLAASSSLFDDAEEAPELPTTAILETVDETGEIGLTVAAGRVLNKKVRVDFAHWKGKALTSGPIVSTATKASWVSEKIVGRPIVRLCGPGPLSGEVDSVRDVNNLARLHAKDESPLPPSGSLLTLTTNLNVTARVFGINRESREFSLAQDVDAGAASRIGFLQFVRRIETAVFDSGNYTLTLSDSGPTFEVDQCVQVLADGKAQIGKIAKLVGPVVGGLTSAPEPGSRLQRLFSVTDVVNPDRNRATVRLKTNTAELVDRFICIHTDNGQKSTAHLAVNRDAQGLDLYQPVQLASLETASCVWRAVYPILEISHSPGEATIDIGIHSLPAFTQIRIADLIDDTSLNGIWNTIPVAETTVVLLCRVKIGDGVPVSAPGTWFANGSDPVPAASIFNKANEPNVVTTTDEHGLTDGDIVEIAGVVGAAGVNGPARVGVVSSKEFKLYKVANAPTAGSGGHWERVDQDEAVTTIANDQFSAVLTAAKTPAAYSRFRLISDGTAQDDIYVGGPIPSSTTTWEALRPVSTFDKDSSYWSPMVPTIPGNGVTALLRTRSAILPETVSTAALAYDHKGGATSPKLSFRAIRTDRRACYLAEEVSEIANNKIRWLSDSLPRAAAFVKDDAEFGKRLMFGEVPPEGERSPSGTTTEQENLINFLEAGRCAGRNVAITANGDYLNVWPIDVPVANIEPTQMIPVTGTGDLSALAVRQVSESLWVAVVRGDDLCIYRIDDAHGPAVSTLVKKAFNAVPSKVLATFTEHDGDVVVAVSDGEALKTWRIRVKRDGTLNAAEPIWVNTRVTDSIVSLSGGQDGGAATFIVGLKDKGNSTSVELWSLSGFVVIRSDEASRLSPRSALGVNFSEVKVSTRNLTARLHPSRRVRFNVDKFRAFAQLEQDNYRCLTLHPTTPDASRGREALTLWTKGDLGNDAFGPAIGPLKLCAASVELQQTEKLKQELKFTVGVKPRVSGSGHEPNTVVTNADVYSRSLLTYVDDQVVSKLGTTIIDIPLHEQTVRILLESDVRSKNNSPTTGVLMLLDQKEKVLLQAVVRCSVDLAMGILELKNDVYWTTVVEPDEDETSSADILLPKFAAKTDGAPHFSVTSFKSSYDAPRGFARLNLTQAAPWQLGTVKVDKSLVSLMPELEPSLVQAPDRISDETVRLAHRLRAGLAVRPVAGIDYFTQLQVESGTTSPTVPTPLSDGKSLLLETVVTVQDGPLVRLRPEGWLVPTKTSEKDHRTDGLFVLNVDFRRDDMPVVCAVETRTREFDPAESGMENERKRYRQLLRASGVQGVAINYRLTDRQEADLGFIDSPFYDHAGDFYDTAGEILSSQTFASSRARTGRALAFSTSVAMPWIYGFDPRLRLPGSVGNERPVSLSASRYIVADLSADPYADVCCLAHRQYRLQRLASHTTEKFDDNATPILHNAEVPAFRQPARLSSPRSGRWMRTVPAADKLSIPQVFFPPRIDWELAAEKPGAMFQSLVQARVTTKERATSREPLIDFALREPQFVRLAECVNAEVYWQTGADETSVSEPENGFANVNLVWTEVVGSVQVDDESATAEWLKPTASGIALSRVPLQLVIDFNSEVFLVNQADAAVPAYRVEAQPDGDDPSVKVLPAATYLVANPDVETVFAPQTVAKNPIDECVISNDDGVWRAKVPEGSVQSGTILTLTDFQEQPELNNVAHRFVGNSNSLFDLMQDTAPDDSVSESLKITVEEIEYDVTIRCRRPFCIDITGDGGTPNDLNAKPLTSTALDEKVRKLKDGEKVIELRLAQIVPGGGQYLIVTPSLLSTTGSGECRNVTTQAAGYLEAAVRLRATLTADPSRAWKPALTLTKADSDALKLVGRHKLVRIESKNVSVNGVFAVLGTDNELPNKPIARPSVGNGRIALDEGFACAFLDEPASSFPIAEITGDTPLLIKLKVADSDGNDIEDPNWDEGKEIAIRNVTSIPQANGTWVVKSVGAFQYALFESPAVEKDVTSINDAVVSAILPLQEGFPVPEGSPADLRFLSLNRDLLDWAPTDRPLLQIYWAGVGHFTNEDGKGVSWRRGGVMVGLYEQIKQVKFLANSQLSPKLAFVMTAPAGTSWQRTILFADSAPPFKAEPGLIKMVDANGTLTTHFRLTIPNNREFLSVPVPQGVDNNKEFVLDLVKSMPSGVAVYDRCRKKPEKNEDQIPVLLISD
jgi:hypothetical protein